MNHRVARTLSILGHPLLVLPAAALALSAVRGSDVGQQAGMAVLLAALAVTVQGWSWWQVRQGRWQHVDASHRKERGRLNRFLLPLLLAGAAWFVWVQPDLPVAWGLASAAALVAAGIVLAPWLKLSLHAAFAVFAACLLWPLGPIVVTLALAFAAAVAWSRWALGRHRPRDLVAGVMVGALVAWGFWSAMARLG